MSMEWKNYPLHFLPESGTKHEGLPVWSNMIGNGPDLRFEANVEHSVSLVEHQVSHPQEICGFLLYQFNKSTFKDDDLT